MKTIGRGNRAARLLATALMASAAGGAMIVLPTIAAAQVQDAPRDYDIPAGSLVDALNRFAEQSGLQLNYEAGLTNGRSSKGLRGRFRRDEAISRLLSGAGLAARATGPDAVTIVAATMGRLDLDPMRVEGAAGATRKDENLNLGEREAREVSSVVILGHQATADKKATTGPWGARDLVDTPYAISVMSNEQIEKTVARDLDQLYKMNPVVQSYAPTTVYGYPQVLIRGLPQSRSVVDGVRLSSYTYGLSTEEIEKVEVMNGLSGFMYGAGNVGGVSNYVLKRPTYERLTNVTVGSFGGSEYFAHADLGGRLDADGAFAYRLNASYSDGDTSKDNQHRKKWLVSGALDWNVTSKLLVQLEGAHSYWHLDGVDTAFYASGFASWPEAYDVKKTYTPDWTYNQTKSDRVGANLKYTINENLSLRTAYLYKTDERQYSIIYPINTPTGWTMYHPTRVPPYNTNSQGAYAYLDGSFDTGAVSHKLTAGASWDTYEEDRHVNNAPRATNADGSAYQIPTGLSAQQLMDLPEPTFPTNYGARYKATEATNRNIVIGDDIAFTDTLSAMVGFNYSTLQTKAFSTAGLQTSGYRKSALTPTVSLLYKPVQAVTAYVSYMEALEAGSIVGSDPTIYTNPGAVLDPVISKQYEVGAKYALSSDLLFSSALFRIEKANSYNSIGTDGRITVNQDGLQIYQGLEVTLTGRLTKNLSLVAGGTLLDLSIEKATNAALQGKKPTGASPTLAKISLDYDVPGIEGLSVSGGAYHSGGKYQDSANLNKITGYTILDLGVRYRTEAFGQPTTFNLYVSNVSGKDYWSSPEMLGVPRNIAFSIRTEF